MLQRREKTMGTRLRIDKRLSGATQDQALLRSIGTLPLRDRCLLRLFLDKGASHGELAGVLGVSRKRVARTLERLLSVASDPGRIALLGAWDRLSWDEQRLAYLHLILEVPLREISRLGLMQRQQADGSLDPVVSRTTLARLLRKIGRKVRRHKARSRATRPDR
jgi:hypothetical protein